MSILGPSFAKQVKQSRSLYGMLKPLADRYANLAGYRKMGLKADDLLLEESSIAQKASTHAFHASHGPGRPRTSQSRPVIVEIQAAQTWSALNRLSERESYDRVFRLRTASLCSIAHDNLPKEQWVKPSEDVRYLKPHILQVEADNADRNAMDSAVRA
ncbi:hypothetical protein JCM8097_003834 [Rhodosporidiobolus ruineniae]